MNESSNRFRKWKIFLQVACGILNFKMLMTRQGNKKEGPKITIYKTPFRVKANFSLASLL